MGISFWRNCGAASVGKWYTKIWFINGVDNVNWPPYRDWKADVPSVSPSSERIFLGKIDKICKIETTQVQACSARRNHFFCFCFFFASSALNVQISVSSLPSKFSLRKLRTSTHRHVLALGSSFSFRCHISVRIPAHALTKHHTSWKQSFYLKMCFEETTYWVGLRSKHLFIDFPGRSMNI